MRRTTYTYAHLSGPNPTGYRGANIANRVLTEVIHDSSPTNIVSQTTYTYDGVAVTSTNSTQAPNHDYTAYGSTFNLRGNLTQISRGLKVGATWTWLNTDNTYDDLGNMLTSRDPGLHMTSYSYVDGWSGAACTIGANTFAFPTQITDPLGHRVRKSYYRCNGQGQSTKDENDIVASRAGTTYTYDLMYRPFTTSFPDGGVTTKNYTDSGTIGITTTQLVATSPQHAQH